MSRCPTGGILPEKCGGGRQERTRCVPGWERLPGMVQWPDLIRAALPSRRHTARPGGAGRFAPVGVFAVSPFDAAKKQLLCIGHAAGRKKAPRIHPRIAGRDAGRLFLFSVCSVVLSALHPRRLPGREAGEGPPQGNAAAAGPAARDGLPGKGQFPGTGRSARGGSAVRPRGRCAQYRRYQ